MNLSTLYVFHSQTELNYNQKNPKNQKSLFRNFGLLKSIESEVTTTSLVGLSTIWHPLQKNPSLNSVVSESADL